MSRLLSLVPGELRTSRLLMAYLAFGFLGGLATQPVRAIVDYLLLAGYAGFIAWWMRARKPVDDDRDETTHRPGRDITVVALVAAISLATVTWFWFGNGPRQLLLGLRDALVHSGVDSLLALKVGNAVIGMALLLLPAAIVTAAAGLRPGQVASIPRHLGLGVALASTSAAIGLLAMLTGQSPAIWKGHGIVLVPALFVVQAGINGLPEEFIFRGVILSRLRSILRTPGTALVLSSVLFSAFHIPSDLSQPGHGPWWGVIPAAILSPGYQPTGLIWGYLCYRAGSIWPGVLWHTASTVFGFIFW